ncbi:hypothetical protein AX766_02145 [Flavobacterium covae]|nr:hypothetical protein AWN65_09135 [Flavobacterium covae]AND63309.1 hypothetical protein AX766_02145 [Flavobacterium covae]OWP87735.1 hypothetical protein BWK60_02280 [Flavobacterium covae]OXA80674.1 hypothetical protein B0A56_06460 [Flavobacterium columnare NBRC 100251 = ATCC 23463]
MLCRKFSSKKEKKKIKKELLLQCNLFKKNHMKLFVDLKNAPPTPFDDVPPVGLSVGCSESVLVIMAFFLWLYHSYRKKIG